MLVSPDKKLGQHFLHDGRVVRRLIENIAQVIDNNTLIIEIGPGTGALTRPLAELPNDIILLEKDKRCVEHLNEWLASDALVSASGPEVSENRQIVVQNVDVLTLDWRQVMQGAKNCVVVGNLPYNVGTEIVADLLHAAHDGPGGGDGAAAPIRHMVFMLQKEVVQRICAVPGGGTWGRLGVLADVLADRQKLFDVPPGAFTPPPKVMSSIVKLTPLPKPRYPVDMKKLDVLLRTAFGQRRKMLRASLRGKIDEKIFAELKIDPTARPEVLTTEQLCRLANALS